MTARPNSPKPHAAPLVLGYAQNKEEEDFLQSWAVSRTWRKGRLAESLAAVVRAFRLRPGILAVAADLRCLCNKTEIKRADVVAALASFEKAKIVVCDMRDPGATHAELLDRAFKSVANARFTKNKRKAKREGAKGGARKGIVMQARRSARVADDIVQRLVSEEVGLTWKVCAWILGEGFTAASLHRQHRESA
jgi:hypothetical protein